MNHCLQLVFHRAVNYFVPAILVPAILFALVSCGGENHNDNINRTLTASSATEDPQAGAAMSDAALIGRKIFFDQSLSASGRMSCASCHDPDKAHAQNNALAVQLGGPNADQPGFRAVPSLRYLHLNPEFAFDEEGTPIGGFNRDGRARTLAEQAQRPFLAPHEMANASQEEVIARLKKTGYTGQFKALFGAAIFDTPSDAFNRVGFALQQYQKEDSVFHPFDSRYDHFLQGKAALGAPELRGLALFNDPAKGNCAACHASAPSADGKPPLFTDFSFDNLGVPRNRAIPATADPAYFDLGLCGPDRTDLMTHTALCGAFKVPTLRNVATRQVFFHNGAFSSLHDVVRFYVRRDTHREEWYPRGPDRGVRQFDDLPPAYRDNVNTAEGPYNRRPNMPPALTEEEIDDVVRFLETLNDGYREASLR
jgi:cytochrome c peroxidase